MYDLQGPNGPVKYVNLGPKEDWYPRWFGDSYRAIGKALDYRSIALVEGYFDLLACRLLAPHAPVLSTGTKSVNPKHIEYLKTFRIKTVHLMFDNDPANEGRSEGAGLQSPRAVAGKLQKEGINAEIHSLPATDPSDCLQDRRTALALQRLLLGIFPVAAKQTECDPDL